MGDTTKRQPGTMALVADLMLQSRLASLRKDDDSAFDAAIAALNESEVVVANLEKPLSRRGSKMLKYSNLRSPPEIIEDVRSMGVDVVSLGNNHMMDYGRDALEDTLAACAQAGILRSGAGMTLEEALAPAQFQVGDKSVAMISISSTLPIGSEANETMAGIAPIRIKFSLEVDTNLINEQPGTMPVVHTWTLAEDQERVCAAISEIASGVDFVVVAIHWGVPTYWLSPYQGLLTPYQQPLGHALLDAGADVLYGHHSHSVHPIEVYNGKPVFYSGGNFLFENARGFMEPESFIVQVDLNGQNPEFRLVPLWIDERGLPIIATGEKATAVLDKLNQLSEPFGTRIDSEGERATLITA
jgi:poly-gamma-glutamate capsule biosynthesis protein CapA/YwtB (metallophosphatase superfamily)